MTNQNDGNIESWEKKEAQIRAERAEEFANLPIEEQERILAEEKKSFHEAQAKLKEELGYGDFDPAKQKKVEELKKAEAEKKEVELANLDLEMDKAIQAPETKESEESPEQKRFATLFRAAEENIEQQKPFQFTSVALDNFGQKIQQLATMHRIVDHSQQKALSSAEIWERLEKKKANPNQIGVIIVVDMGEDKSNSLGLVNLQLEVSLESLLEGHFTEKIGRFVNLVLYAAVMHDRKKRLEVEAKKDSHEEKKESNGSDNDVQVELDKHAIAQIADNGGLNMAHGLFESGQSGTIAFSFNNGAIWGTFDAHGAPSNPKELQESIDKTSTDK